MYCNNFLELSQIPSYRLISPESEGTPYELTLYAREPNEVDAGDYAVELTVRSTYGQALAFTFVLNVLDGCSLSDSIFEPLPPSDETFVYHAYSGVREYEIPLRYGIERCALDLTFELECYTGVNNQQLS